MTIPTPDTPPQHVTVEIMGLAPRLRDDLQVSVQIYAGQTCYLIEDPISSRFSRVGLAEYTLLSLLDGQTTIAEAIARTAALMGPDALSEHEAAALCKWLIDSQLAETTQSRGAGRLCESADRSLRRKAAARLNPIFQKVPLFHPGPLLRRTAPWCDWIFSGTAMITWVALVLVGLSTVTSQWDRFTTNSGGILARDNWIWLLLAWLALKLLHEAGHALACHRLGGNVREAGVMFVLMAPLPYVDVTSSWRFESKFSRILTAAAGMYVELAVAAMMAVVWSTTDNPLLQQHARNMIVTATVVTVLFNLNPLMRFDGYYMLSDWLELPNLATHGRQLLSYFGRRHLLGAPATGAPDWPEGRTFVVATYGVAACAWRVFICIALILAAQSLLWGAGIVLSAVAVMLWVVIPAARIIGKLADPNEASRRRTACVATLLFGALAGIYFLPWYSHVTAPVRVDFHSVREIRTPVGGFVEQVVVDEGDVVEAGQLVAVLENRELQLDAERLRIEMQQSEARARKFRQAHEIAAYQVEMANGRALDARRSELLDRLAHLQVRAPAAGVVTRSDLKQLLGTFVKPGERLLSIGARGPMRLQALVAQNAAEPLSTDPSRPARIHVWGTGGQEFSIHFQRVHPRATTTLVHPAFASVFGGPLAVREKVGHDASDRWELVDPHVLAEAVCDSTTRLAPGQTGVAQFWHYRGHLGEILFHRIMRWFHRRGE